MEVNLKKTLILPRYLTLITAGLTYFANSFCINLTYVLKRQPLVEFGIVNTKIEANYTDLLVLQHIGILLGIVIFGLLADKKRRVAMLFISAFLYSLGTLLGGFATNYYLFVLLRFLVGLGLAAELGIGLVLVCEVFPKESKSYAVIFLAFCGFLGMFAVSILANITYWRNIYIISGILGLVIMLLRFSTFEADIFLKANNDRNSKKTILSLIRNKRIYYFILGILPTYLIIACLLVVGIELLNEPNTHITQTFPYFAIGSSIGFLLLGIVGNTIRSRKKIVIFCLISLIIFFAIYIFSKPILQYEFLLLSFIFGLLSSYQFELLILSTEQFSPNIRSIATTFVFGVGRASIFFFSILIPMVNSFFDNFLHTIFFLGSIIFILALWGISKIKEDYGQDFAF